MFPSSIPRNYNLVPSSSSSSPSPSSSSSSSTSSSSPPFSLLPNTTKTMEEVWKDITITSLPNTPLPHHHHHIHHPTPSSSFRGMILQDFLNNSRDPPLRAPVGPPTGLGLNTGPEYRFFDMNNGQGNPMQGAPAVPGFNGESTFDALASNSVLATFGGSLGKKRFSDNGDENGIVDRRNKRMIKNRESAARSRARKQAYIQELENENNHLREEIARLQKQQQQQLLEEPATQLPKKHGLHRTSTAPF